MGFFSLFRFRLATYGGLLERCTARLADCRPDVGQAWPIVRPDRFVIQKAASISRMRAGDERCEPDDEVARVIITAQRTVSLVVVPDGRCITCRGPVDGTVRILHYVSTTATNRLMRERLSISGRME